MLQRSTPYRDVDAPSMYFIQRIHQTGLQHAMSFHARFQHNNCSGDGTGRAPKRFTVAAGHAGSSAQVSSMFLQS